MNLEDCTNKYTKTKSYSEFCASGLKAIREHENDDYFIYGTFDSDRTKCLAENMQVYKAKRNVCFAVKGTNIDQAYKLDSPMRIDINDMFVTEEMTEKFFDEFQREDGIDEVYITVDLNSFNREFLLLLATMLFKSKRKVIIRFLYFSSGSAVPYALERWMALEHKKPEVLLVSPGVPVFDDTALVLVAGYEVKAVERFVDRFRPSKLILGYNKLGVNEKAQKMNEQTHEACRLLMDRYKNSPMNPTDNIKEFKCDVRCPVACCRDIDAVIRKNCALDTHIKLAATNTRLSLIGAALFAAQKNKVHNVQLVYAEPIGFEEKTFSSGVTEYYEYTFDTSHLDKLREEFTNETN